MTDLMTRPEIADPTTGAPDKAHICRKADVARAYVTGEAIEALCGKKWIPSRDPENLPVCQACSKVLEQLRSSSAN